MEFNIKLHNSLSELDSLSEKLRELGETWHLPDKIIHQINLVLDELFTNTVTYGYSDDLDHIISISFDYDTDQIFIKMVDDGHNFDPTEQEEPDMSLTPEERELGGLGIFLVHKYIDEITHAYKDGNNIIHMVKKLHKKC